MNNLDIATILVFMLIVCFALIDIAKEYREKKLAFGLKIIYAILSGAIIYLVFTAPV